MLKDDTLWKGILENVFDDFLRFFFTDADVLFDMEKGFTYLDKELDQLFPMDEGTSPKFVDKLVKVFTKTGKEEWVLIHIEVQGYSDKDFAKRMFQYFYRILDKYDKPVTALAIFTDTDKAFQLSVYEYDNLGTSNVYRFRTYKVLGQDEVVLAKNENPFAIVVLTILLALKKKKLDDDSLLNLKIEIFRNLYKRKINEKKMRGLATFLKLYVHFAKPETVAKFEQAIQTLTENNNTMGIEEMVLDRAKNEGIKQEQEKTIVRLIEKMGLTDAQIADIIDVPVSVIEKVRNGLKK